MSAHHHSAGRRYGRQQVVAFGQRAFLIIYKVRLDVVVQIAALQQRALLCHHIVEEYLLVSRQRRVYVVERHGLCVVAYNHAHQRSGVAVYLIVFGCVHDTSLIQSVQLFGYYVDVLVWQSGNAVVEVGEELAHLLLLHRLVVVVVRLVSLQQRVFLGFYGFVCLVDREVELGNERAVHPRLADVVSESLTLVAWQRPYYHRHRHHHQRHTCEHIAPEMFSALVNSVHTLSYYRFGLQYYKKNV